jgi:hypothetical protein
MARETEEVTCMARMRSPNFPGLPLEDAINSARVIWDKNRKAPISREAVAKDLGYAGLTGRSFQVLGALNQYGLVENIAKGQMRVTQTAEDIFVGYPEEVRRAAVSKAAREPGLFQAIYEKFEGIAPGENAVRSFLFQRGFTNEGVEKALKSFLETNRYAEINGDSESYRSAAESPPESAPDQIDWETATVEPAVQAQPPEPKAGLAIYKSGPLDFSLTSTGLSLTGKTASQKELRAFIEKLNALAVLLPEDEPDLGEVMN